MPGTIEQAHALLDKLAAERFFGTVSFQFKAGEVSLIRKEETILPTNAVTKPNDGRTGDRYEHSKAR